MLTFYSILSIKTCRSHIPILPQVVVSEYNYLQSTAVVHCSTPEDVPLLFCWTYEGPQARSRFFPPDISCHSSGLGYGGTWQEMWDMAGYGGQWQKMVGITGGKQQDMTYDKVQGTIYIKRPQR